MKTHAVSIVVKLPKLYGFMVMDNVQPVELMWMNAAGVKFSLFLPGGSRYIDPSDRFSS